MTEPVDTSRAHDAAASIARLLALGGELMPAAAGAPRHKYELDHMRTLLARLGSPEQRFRSVLIAGTNGKGSTAATLASILFHNGTRAGLYTSPHLEAPNERIRVDEQDITDADLARHFEAVAAASVALVAEGALPYPPSFFETMTAIAFLHFAEQHVDLAVLEVGLGGRLDATNVVEPLVSVIADISLEHTEWLGNTVRAITLEKAGILRPHGILVTLPQHPEANQAIGEVAVSLEVDGINAAEYLPSLRPQASAGTGRNTYILQLPGGALAGAAVTVDSPLGGAHQQRNLALAIATAIALHQRYQVPLTVEGLERGIRYTRWPGRLQLLPAARPQQAPMLLDAAHNPAGAWALRSALSGMETAGRRTLIFGCMADKAIQELGQILFPVFDEVLLTRAPTARAAATELLVVAAKATGAPYRVYEKPADAVLAARLSTPANGLVVVAGSIALIGEVLASAHVR